VLEAHVGDLARSLAGEQIIRSASAATRSSSSSSARQNFGISESDNTRSRLAVALRATSLHGFSESISSLIAQLKIALAAASTWLATVGLSTARIVALTSARLIEAASSLPHRGRRKRRTRASACRQDLFSFLACCSTYFSASSAKLLWSRSACFSASGSSPSATAARSLAAIRRASANPISPMWYHRARPRKLDTNLKLRCPEG
jgi:hypothetical protein